MQTSPITSCCQFDKGFIMTAVGGVTDVKATKQQAQRVTSLEEMDHDIAIW